MLPSFTETAGRLCVTRLLTLGLVVSAAMPGLEIGGRHDSHSSFSSHSRLQLRQATQSTPSPNTLNFVIILSDYWYVVLVVVVGVVVIAVFLCACIVWNKKRYGQHHMRQLHLRSPDSARQCALTNHINTSFADLGSGSPGSLSVVHTPIPSPQPSYSSSHKSVRSSRRGSTHKRQRNHSPGHTSSGSEDTIRPYQDYSMSSLTSSLSTIGGRVNRTESLSSGHGSERTGHTHRRTISNPQVKVTALTGDSPLHSAPSTLSIDSSHTLSSHQSTVESGVIKVDVKVHLDQEKAARCQIAAALAESARQLAQSAANFEQEDDLMSYLQYPTSRRQLFPNHYSSRGYQVPMASLDSPGNMANLDRVGKIASLDRVKDRKRRNSITSHMSFKSDSPLSISRNYPISRPLLEFETPTHSNVTEPKYSPFRRVESGVHYHAENGLQVLPNFHHHVYATDSSPNQPKKKFLTCEEKLTASLDFPPSPRTQRENHSLLKQAQFGTDSMSRSGEENIESGQGTDSNASTLKASAHSGTTGRTNSLNLIPDYHCTSKRHLSQLVNGEVLEIANLLTVSQSEEVPHSSQPVTLSRSASGLSLDPPLSSTASGYAATGSNSSLDTDSKTTQSSEHNLYPQHSLDAQPPEKLLALSSSIHLEEEPKPSQITHEKEHTLSPKMTASSEYNLGMLGLTHRYQHGHRGNQFDEYHNCSRGGTPPLPLTSELSWTKAERKDYTFPHHIGFSGQDIQRGGLSPLTDCSSESITVDV